VSLLLHPFPQQTLPQAMVIPEIAVFLTNLVVTENVAAFTQKFSSLWFLDYHDHSRNIWSQG
jgi:hypothetical protein